MKWDSNSNDNNDTGDIVSHLRFSFFRFSICVTLFEPKTTLLMCRLNILTSRMRKLSMSEVM